MVGAEVTELVARLMLWARQLWETTGKEEL